MLHVSFGVGLFFRWRGVSFLSGGGGAPHEGHRFCWGVFEKNHRLGGGATSPLPLTMGNPAQVSQGKSGNLLEDQGKKILSMQICNFNKKSYASRNVCS